MSNDWKNKIEEHFKQPLWLLIVTALVVIILYILKNN